ncbi:MAG TPA: hypothetical protein VG318_12095 [Actinomycetota bacterium]|nr:hypothetical protein [Actinomycetota bacterium]
MKRHRFDPYALVFGLSFTALAAVLLDTDVDLADLAGAGWLPLPVVFGGLLLLAVGLDRARPEPELEPAGEPPADETGQM